MYIGTYNILQGRVAIPAVWLKNNPNVKRVDISIDGNKIVIKAASGTKSSRDKTDAKTEEMPIEV